MRSFLFLCAFLPCLTAPPASGQGSFPSRVVTIVVPYPAGGGVDVLGRAMAEKLSTMWGKPVIIENKPGGSTFIGTQAVAGAAPDGHTLLMTTDATVTSNPHFFAKMPYNATKDLAPISQLATFDLMLLANPKLGVSTVDELITKARDSKEPIPYASFGNGSQSHVFFAAFARSRKANLLHIPYAGIAPSLRAVVAGEVMLSMAGSGTAGGFVTEGRVKPLAISRPTRNPRLPAVPTFKEAGIGDLDPTPWFGVFAPAGTPLALRERIQSDIASVFADRAFDEKFLEARGYLALMTTPTQFAAEIAREMDIRGKQIELSGVKIQE